MSAKRDKDPAFLFYPRDWLSCSKIAVMTPAQIGGYIMLLCHAWNDPDCSLPDDDKELSILSRLGEGWFGDDGRVLRKCFQTHAKKQGRIFNKRLSLEREKRNAFLKKSSQGGKKSGVTRSKGASLLLRSKREANGNIPFAFASSFASSSLINTPHTPPGGVSAGEKIPEAQIPKIQNPEPPPIRQTAPEPRPASAAIAQAPAFFSLPEPIAVSPAGEACPQARAAAGTAPPMPTPGKPCPPDGDCEPIPGPPDGDRPGTAVCGPSPNQETPPKRRLRAVVTGDDRAFCEAVIADLNQRTGRTFRAGNHQAMAAILARRDEGFTLEDFRSVHEKKCAAWLNDPRMSPYLRPETLYRPSKFESYLNEPDAAEVRRLAVVHSAQSPPRYVSVAERNKAHRAEFLRRHRKPDTEGVIDVCSN